MEVGRPKFYCMFQKSNSTSISLKNITRSEAERRQEQKCEPAQWQEFFVKIQNIKKSFVLN
jgi:hypothetical protein